ncbi:uncharacterized protein LOC109604798 isoform X2 [Aethina tumida]|uniref:uncharacterized protein LOC109604798 isoform X2 n=1 Tax=Aethina tumida TaxID=116153 RepID=UPI00214913D1|nr:uncharacterized protein LOC109604798 isoform X2 [Aethina tumida]
MFTAELSSDFKTLLRDITPNFEENLNRAFNNAAIRSHQRKKSFVHKVDNTVITLNDTKIELRNLKFPWVPDFRINYMSANLAMLCLDVGFKLGDLRVEGDFEANNSVLQTLLPVSNIGKIAVTFKNVTAQGKVGLLIEEDSLVPTNYDLTYTPTETETAVSYFGDDIEIENKITKSNGEQTLGDSIWDQITDILTNLLHRQLGETVVEFSLTELLVDKDEELRDIAREHSTRANRLLDSLLCKAKDYLVAKDRRSVKTPPFDVVYRGKPSGVEQGWLRTDEGYMQDLSTLTRIQGLSLYEDKAKLTVYGSIVLRDFKHGYEKYYSNFEGNKISGSIRTSVYKNRIFLKLVMMKDGEVCSTKLETVQVVSVKDIDVDASGLASLSWLVPRLKSWVIANLRYQAVPVLEKHIKEAFNHAISNTDCLSLISDQITSPVLS